MIIFLLKRKLLLAIVAMMVLVTTIFPAEAYGEENLSMYSGSYALTDARTNRVLVGKKETTPMANASTTKILTCIVTLERCQLNEQVKISQNAAKQPKVRLGVKQGEVYALEELLYALMLESYNDCAVAIAEHVAGTTEKFAEILNEKAKEIGCTDTYFITPNGLDAQDDNSFHHTTAEDLCKMMAYCVWQSPQKEKFLQITQMRNYGDYVNRNSFLDQMDGVLSGKTGYTSKAGYCYVAAFEKDGERFCIALLACGWPNNKTYKWKDAREILTFGIEEYEVVHKAEEKLEEVFSFDGCVGEKKFSNINQTMALQVEGVCAPLEVLMGEDEKIEKEVILYTDTRLPIEKGQIMGVCNYYIGDILLQEVQLMATEKVEKWSYLETIKILFWEYLSFSSQTS